MTTTTITPKQARETMPKPVSDFVTDFCKQKRIRKVRFGHSDKFYCHEDAELTLFSGEQTTGLRIGGEFGGAQNLGLIAKTLPIPVGCYAVETKIFLGRWFITVYHNNGQPALG